MKSPFYPHSPEVEDKKRFIKQKKLPQIGESGQKKLSNAKILLVGMGGLGSAIAPYLCNAGIGTLGMVDGDRIEISNLHRQAIYREELIGQYKVDAAQKHLSELSPTVKLHTYDNFLNRKNGRDILSKYDVVVDGTDNVPTRYLLSDLCQQLNKPWIYGAVYQFEGQVSTFNYKNGPSYRDLFAEDESIYHISCNDSGTLGSTVSFIAMLQANEVFKIILELETVLSGKLLVYNLLENKQNLFSFEKSKKVDADEHLY